MHGRPSACTPQTDDVPDKSYSSHIFLQMRCDLLYCKPAEKSAILRFRQKFCLLVEFAALAAKFRRSGGLRSLRV